MKQVLFAGISLVCFCSISFSEPGNLGAVTYKAIMTGSGQVRTDMGSHPAGGSIWAVNFTNIETVTNGGQAFLQWTIESGYGTKEFVIEQKITGSNFTEIKRVALTYRGETSFITTIPEGITAQYRVKAIGTDEKSFFSPAVQYISKTTTSLRLLSNPVQHWQLSFIPNVSGTCTYIITASNGGVMQRGSVACEMNIAKSIDLRALNGGIYIFQLKGAKESTVRFVVQ
jgi:hypothetical protein